MKFYTIKSRITGKYLSGLKGFLSSTPVYLTNGQVNFWVGHFTRHRESYKLDEMVLESYSLSDPRPEDTLLRRKRDKVEKEEIVQRLTGYE